jgi:hypothetical protein
MDLGVLLEVAKSSSSVKKSETSNDAVQSTFFFTRYSPRPLALIGRLPMTKARIGTTL